MSDPLQKYDPLYPNREIIARAWSDDAFKSRLLSDPMAVMKEFGARIPTSIKEIRVVENTHEIAYYILPVEPAQTDMTDDQIKETIDRMLLTQFVFPTVLV